MALWNAVTATTQDEAKGALALLGKRCHVLWVLRLVFEAAIQKGLAAANVPGDSPGPSSQSRLGSLRNQINWRRA